MICVITGPVNPSKKLNQKCSMHRDQLWRSVIGGSASLGIREKRKEMRRGVKDQAEQIISIPGASKQGIFSFWAEVDWTSGLSLIMGSSPSESCSDA